MPMIGVCAAVDLFPAEADRQLGEQMTLAILRAEGVAAPSAFHLNNTAAFIHRMSPAAIRTAVTDSASTVRVQIVTAPGALSRDGQRQLVKEVTDIVATISGDPSQGARTWVILTEAAEGGWGIAGTAFGKQELIALAEKGRTKRPSEAPSARSRSRTGRDSLARRPLCLQTVWMLALYGFMVQKHSSNRKRKEHQ